MKREYFGAKAACKVATKLIAYSVPFDFEPLPCDVFAFAVKGVNASLLPPENVGRDALVSDDGSGEGAMTCKHCARKYGADDGLFEGDPCPSDDCPSHDTNGWPE